MCARRDTFWSHLARSTKLRPSAISSTRGLRHGNHLFSPFSIHRPSCFVVTHSIITHSYLEFPISDHRQDQKRGGNAHPLHGHQGLEPFNDMQSTFDSIFTCSLDHGPIGASKDTPCTTKSNLCPTPTKVRHWVIYPTRAPFAHIIPCYSCYSRNREPFGVDISEVGHIYDWNSRI